MRLPSRPDQESDSRRTPYSHCVNHIGVNHIGVNHMGGRDRMASSLRPAARRALIPAITAPMKSMTWGQAP